MNHQTHTPGRHDDRALRALGAYEDSAQGERLALRQMQAIDALRSRVSATSSVRTSAPGRTFTLTEHPTHDGSDMARDQHVILKAEHRARNNVSADLKAQINSHAGVSTPRRPAFFYPSWRAFQPPSPDAMALLVGLLR